MNTSPAHVSTSTAPSSTRDDVTIDDFITGLIAAFATREVASISIRGPEFYRAVADVYDKLLGMADTENLDVRFVVSLDPMYEDSPVVRDAISAAVQRDLVSLDNPEYQDMRLKVRPSEGKLFLKRLPLSAEMYEQLADGFLENYPWYVRR